MANSKSNIYPIQLQGAELNLNKLDAEIKQYSGFNKNNSPFVGGCLSNVFTKEEQISGGNADNTYIDEAGNIYKVDDEGLYQNGIKIIEYTDKTKFYNKRKIFSNRAIVKAVTEKIYIDIEGENYYVHWGDNFKHEIGPVKSDLNDHLDIVYKNGVIVFTHKWYNYVSVAGTYFEAGDVKAYRYIIIITDENNESCFVEKHSDGNREGDFCLRLPHEIIDSNNPETHPMGCYLSDPDENQKCELFINWNEDNGNGNAAYSSQTPTSPHGDLRYYVIDLSQPVGNRLSHPFNDNRFYYSSSFNNLISYSTCAYYLTNDGFMHFTHIPYTRNTTPQWTISETTSRNLVFRPRYNSNLSTYKFTTGEVTCYLEMDYQSVLYNKVLKDKDNSVYYPSVDKINNNHFSNWAALYTTVLVDTSNPDNELVISINGIVNNVAVLNDGKYSVDAGINFVGDFKVLLNNGKLSNISIAGFENNQYSQYEWPYYRPTSNSLHGVILEDWNSIEDFIIFDNGSKVTYKIGGDFYTVERVNEPKIFVKDNQLVINCNDEKNAFDITRQIVLHYGSDWNNSFIYKIIDNYTFNMYSNEFWIASAINEYNMKDNPSLILNAKQVLMLGNFLTNIRKCYSLKDFFYRCAVNIYKGDSDQTNAYYYGSSSDRIRFNPDLIGLPFPNNTDGNVQSNPSLFSKFISNFGVDIFIQNNNKTYQLMKEGQENIMSYFLGTLIEGLELVFIIQGQFYGIIDNKLFGIQFNNGVIADASFIVNVQGLQFVGNTPYEALFFSKTNRCLYSFTGANVLNQKQLVDKISEVRNYLYNPATQTVFLITDIGVLFYGLFGMFLLEYTDITNIFLLDNGIVMSDNSGNYRYIKYYLDEGDEGYTKENIRLETCFYGMNNEVVTINDCLYFRLFSEEHEEGDLKVKATTISLKGRQTEETTFKIKASDWDKITHTIYLRYQPKTQRGLGVSFSIDSPFKIASMSVGSQPDAVLVDRVSKGAITAPSVTTNNNEW